MSEPLNQKLDDDLILRSASKADTDALAALNASIHSDDGPDQPEESLAALTRDLLSRPHPTFHAGLTTIVEEASTGRIVSTALLIPQTWTYAGVPFGVGQPELIATLPDFRNRGLVRRQMDVLHRWSAELGHKMQAIAGIPWFYRQFGYEMGLDLGGGRDVYRSQIPQLKKKEVEAFHFRAATAADIPFIRETFDQDSANGLIHCKRSESEWTYEISGREQDNHSRVIINIIETTEGLPAGYAVHPHNLPGDLLPLQDIRLRNDFSHLDVTPALLRYLDKTGQAFGDRQDRTYKGVSINLVQDHPIFQLFPSVFSRTRSPYAWYIRIPDLPDFLNTIRPVLNQRLSSSPFKGYTGQVNISFYRSGFSMDIKEGALIQAAGWQPSVDKSGDVRFPDLMFLSMLCGRRSFKELSDFFADCFSFNEEIRSLMDILFPKQSSSIWGIS